MVMSIKPSIRTIRNTLPSKSLTNSFYLPKTPTNMSGKSSQDYSKPKESSCRCVKAPMSLNATKSSKTKDIRFLSLNIVTGRPCMINSKKEKPILLIKPLPS